jgi:hypothetical protein
MRISHEVPLCLLDSSFSFNSYCYCLVHLLPLFKEYREHYYKAVQDGRHVLLDNSVFELGEAYNSDEFADWINRLTPTEYIIPDVLEDAEKTKANFVEFTSKYPNLPGKAIAVVQGKTYDEIKDLYLYFLNEQSVSKIAISFDYSFYTGEDCMEYAKRLNFETHESKWWNFALGRAATLFRLKEDGILSSKKKLHLLGCSLPLEFGFYKYLELDTYIDTIDTSNPIVAGILGKRYEEYGLREKWSQKLIDFMTAELTVEQVKNIWYNVDMFRKIVNK